MVNFGSFTFLSAVDCSDWKNVNVPKCAVAAVGSADDLCLLGRAICAEC